MFTLRPNPFDLFAFDPGNYTRLQSGHYRSRGGRVLTARQYEQAVQRSRASAPAADGSATAPSAPAAPKRRPVGDPIPPDRIRAAVGDETFGRYERGELTRKAVLAKARKSPAWKASLGAADEAARATPAEKAEAVAAAPALADRHMPDAPPAAKQAVAAGLADIAGQSSRRGVLAAAGRMLASLFKLPFRAMRAGVLGVLRAAKYASDKLGLVGRTVLGGGGMYAGGWAGAKLGMLLGGPLGAALGTAVGGAVGALAGRGDTESLGRLFTLRGVAGQGTAGVLGGVAKHLLNVALIPAAGVLPLLIPGAMSEMPGLINAIGPTATKALQAVGRSLFGSSAEPLAAAWATGLAASLAAMWWAQRRMRRAADQGRVTDIGERVTYEAAPAVTLPPWHPQYPHPQVLVHNEYDAFAWADWKPLGPDTMVSPGGRKLKKSTYDRLAALAQKPKGLGPRKSAAPAPPAKKAAPKKAAPKRKAPAKAAAQPAFGSPEFTAALAGRPGWSGLTYRAPDRSPMAAASAPVRPAVAGENGRARHWEGVQAARAELHDLTRRLREQRGGGARGLAVDVGQVRQAARRLRRNQRLFAASAASEPTPPAVAQALGQARSPVARAAGWVAHKLGTLAQWLGGTVIPATLATGTAAGVAGLGATTGMKLGLLFGGPLGMAVGTAAGGGLGLLAARAVAVPAFRVASAALGQADRSPFRRAAVSANKLATAVLPRAAGLAAAAPVGAVTVPLGLAASGAMTPLLGPALGLAASGALGKDAEKVADAMIAPGAAGIMAPGQVYGGVAGAIRSGLESDPRRRKRQGTTLALGRTGRKSAGSYEESRFSEAPDDLAELKALLPQVAPGLALTDADLRLILAAVERAVGGAAPATFREQGFESFYWQLTQTRTNKPKAVWGGAARRKPLYGDDALRAVKSQGGSANAPPPAPAQAANAQRTPPGRAARQAFGRRVRTAAGKAAATVPKPVRAGASLAARGVRGVDRLLGRGTSYVLTGLGGLADAALNGWVGRKYTAVMDAVFGKPLADGRREAKGRVANALLKKVGRAASGAVAKKADLFLKVRDAFRQSFLGGLGKAMRGYLGLFNGAFRANVAKFGGGPVAVAAATAVELTAGVADWVIRAALGKALPAAGAVAGGLLTGGAGGAAGGWAAGKVGQIAATAVLPPGGLVRSGVAGLIGLGQRLATGRPATVSAVRARKAAARRLMFGPQGGAAEVSDRDSRALLAKLTPLVRQATGNARLRYDSTRRMTAKENRPFVQAVTAAVTDPAERAAALRAMAVTSNRWGSRRQRTRAANDLLAVLRAQHGGRFAERFAEAPGLPALLAAARELLAGMGHANVPDRDILAALGTALHAMGGGGPVESFAWREGPRGGDYWLPDGRPDTPDNRLYGQAARAAAEAARAAFGRGPNEYGDVHLDDGHTVSLKPDAGGAVRIDFAKHGNAMKSAPALQGGTLDFLRRLKGLVAHLAAGRTPVAFGGADVRRERMYAGELRAVGYAPVGLRQDMTVEWRHRDNLGGKRPLTDAEYEALVKRLPARMAELVRFAWSDWKPNGAGTHMVSPGGRSLTNATFAKLSKATPADTPKVAGATRRVAAPVTPDVPAVTKRVTPAASPKMSRAQKAKVNALFDKIRGIDYALADGIPDHLVDARKKLRAERADLVKQIEALLPAPPKTGTTGVVPPTTPVVGKPPTVAEATYARAQAEYPRLRDEYLQQHGTFKGRALTGVTLNTDEWRGQFPEYTGTNAADTHEAASYLNDRLFQEALTKLKGKGNGRMIVLAGGGGSGKGTATKGMGLDDYPIRLDQVSGDFDKLMKKFSLGQANGFAPEYTFIDRAPELAWDGVVSRAVNGRKKGGVARTVPLEVALKANLDARAVAIRVLKERPDIPATVIDNNGGPGTAKMLVGEDAVRHLERQQHDYQTLLEKLRRDTLSRPGLDDDIRVGLVGPVGPAAADDRRVQPAGPPRREGAGAADAGAGRPAGGAGGQVRQSRAGHPRRLTAAEVKVGRRIAAAVADAPAGKTMAELRALTGLPPAEFDRLATKLHAAGVVRLLDDGTRPADPVRTPGNRTYTRIRPADPKTAVSLRSAVGRQRTEGQFSERMLRLFRV